MRAPKTENTVFDATLNMPLGRHSLVVGAQWSNAKLTDQKPARWPEAPNYRLWYSYNIDNAAFRGLELTARYKPSRALNLSADYTCTDSGQKGGDLTYNTVGDGRRLWIGLNNSF